MNFRPQTAARLTGVKEVSLRAAANLDFWREKLKVENLLPIPLDGQAQILVVAAEGIFCGLRFREISISVLAADSFSSPPREGAYLANAFNSRRFFAFCERAFFSTPYQWGTIQLRVAIPCEFALDLAGQQVLRATMGNATPTMPHETIRQGIEQIAIPLFLPGKAGRRPEHGKLFFAELQGDTATYPFLPQRDTLHLQPADAAPIVADLVASQFAPYEWIVRTSAIHAKSKTYRFEQVPAHFAWSTVNRGA